MGDDPPAPNKARGAGGSLANVNAPPHPRALGAASTGAAVASAASADLLAAVMAGMQQQAEQARVKHSLWGNYNGS